MFPASAGMNRYGYGGLNVYAMNRAESAMIFELTGFVDRGKSVSGDVGTIQ